MRTTQDISLTMKYAKAIALRSRMFAVNTVAVFGAVLGTNVATLQRQITF